MKYVGNWYLFLAGRSYNPGLMKLLTLLFLQTIAVKHSHKWGQELVNGMGVHDNDGLVQDYSNSSA